MRRWPPYVRIVAVLVLVLVVHGAGWWLLSRRVAAGWDSWVAAERAQGVNVTAGSQSLTGWPLAGGVQIGGIAVEGPGWRWSAEMLDVTVRPWSPGRLRLEPSGLQTLAAGTFAVSGRARAELLTVALPAGDDPVFQSTGLALDTPFGPLTLEQAAGHLQAAGDGTGFGCHIMGIELPAGPSYVLGRSIAAFTLEASVPGLLPLPRAPDLAAWRGSGGVMRISAARLRWRTLTVEASGTGSLDPSLQPVADLHVVLTGQDAALDQAAAQGLIQPRAATAVRAVLALLSRASPAPGSAPGALSVSLRDGVVALAGFPVARVPAVAWPAR